MITKAQMYVLLLDYCAPRGGQAKLAAKTGYSGAMISQIMNGAKEIPDVVARQVGYRKVTMFVPIKGGQNGTTEAK